MSPRDSSNILGRGAFLVGATDVCISLSSITACIVGIIEPEHWKDDKGQRVGFAVDTVVLVAMLITFLCCLLFSILLLVGVYKGKSTFILSWFIPNIVMISVVFTSSFVLAFTRFGYFVLFLPSLLCFRAFETWIVAEFRWKLKHYHK